MERDRRKNGGKDGRAIKKEGKESLVIHSTAIPASGICFMSHEGDTQPQREPSIL